LILMTGSPLRAHCSEEGALRGNIFHPPPAYISPCPPSLSAGGGAKGRKKGKGAVPCLGLYEGRKARARKADSTKGANKKVPPTTPNAASTKSACAVDGGPC
jgi:hypothetical protein